MIDRATSAALDAIAARERDVLHAYEPGFVPEAADAARAAPPIRSLDPLSVAAPQGTYFTCANGSGGIALTRDGGFALSGGELQTRDGRSILGFPLGARGKLVPLRIDPYDAALGGVSDARVDADGTFAYTRTAVDPRSGTRRSERVVVGRIALARLPAGTQPIRLDASRVAAPAGVNAQLGVPADGRFAALAPHARDVGGLDLVAGLAKMQEAYVSFDALRAAHHARGTLEKTAMDLLK